MGKMFLALALAVVVSGALSAAARAGFNGHDVSVPFDFSSDTLCFNNHEAKSGPWPLKQIGQKKGICQGMIAVARGFRNHVKFTCSGPGLNQRQARARVDQVMRLHARGCSDTIEIEGYCSLREFCQAHRSVLEHKATWVNLELGISPLLGHVPAFRAGATPATQVQNMAAIRQISDELDAGRTPMLAVAWHVVMVLGLEVTPLRSGNFRADLKIYDPNYAGGSSLWSYTIAPDFKRTVDEGAIFVISPHFYGPAHSCRTGRKGSIF